MRDGAASPVSAVSVFLTLFQGRENPRVTFQTRAASSNSTSSKPRFVKPSSDSRSPKYSLARFTTSLISIVSPSVLVFQCATYQAPKYDSTKSWRPNPPHQVQG